MVLIWILVPAGVIIAALSFVAFRNRKPHSLEAGLRDFRRGLDALDPANDPLKRAKADGRNQPDPDAPRGQPPKRR